MKLNWDTEIPSDLIKQWNDLLKILNGLDFIEVTPNVSFTVSAKQVYVHTELQFTLKLFCNQGKFIPISI